MKTFYTLFSLFACALPLVQTARAQQAAAYAIADTASGRILESSNADKKLQVGSLTKIATAMVVLDWVEASNRDIGTMVTVPASITHIATSNPVGFQPGDQISLRDLLYAAMLQSDNIAAYTLANYVGQSFVSPEHPGIPPVDLFVAQMNALARKLGLLRTKFLNPHGLDNEEKPYSTAQDLVLLSSYAMKRSSFRFYVSQKNRKIARHLATGETAEYNLVNTNALLGVDNIDGVKTGKTARAGECLILSSARAPESIQNADGSHTITPRRLIVVVLGAPDRFNLGERLLARGWDIFDRGATGTTTVNRP